MKQNESKTNKTLLRVLLAAAAVLLLCGAAIGAAAGAATTVNTEDELIAAVAAGGEVILGNNISLSKTLTISTTVTLDLDGYVLSLESGKTGSVIEVGLTGYLTVKDTGSTPHWFEYAVAGSAWKLYSGADPTPGATVKVYNSLDQFDRAEADKFLGTAGNNVYIKVTGGCITGGVNDKGGGVYVRGGTLTMSGGIIIGNSATESGGGVFSNSTGTINMSGGTIVGNSAPKGGGAVISGTMSGGTIVGNSAQNGGGVFVSNDKFTMVGGTIVGNRASGDGGGVYVEHGTFNVSGSPVIKGNVKTNETSNVYLYSTVLINFTGNFTGEIYINRPAGADEQFGIAFSKYAGADHFISDKVYSGKHYVGVWGTESGGTFPLIWESTAEAYPITISAGIEHGSAAVSVSAAKENTEITLTATPDAGYVPDQWDVKDASSNPITVSGNKFTMPASAVTVSATFKKEEPKPTTATVIFDLQGHGTQIKDQEVTIGEKVPEPEAPSTVGYTFGGWYKEPECSTEWNFSDPVNSDMTLYAKWTAKTTTVTLDPNNKSTGPFPTVTATYDADMPAITTLLPTRAGYTFTGYYDASTAGTKYYNADGTSAKKWDKDAETATLYAYWSLKAPVITQSPPSVTYGYTAPVELTATTDSGFTPSSYQWYEVNEDGSETQISGKTTKTYEIPVGKAAGSYKYKVEIGDGTSTIKSEVYTVTVNQRTAALEWTNLTFTYDKTLHTPTATVSNLVNGDSCTVTVEGGQTNAGQHSATASTLSNPNYALGEKSHTFTISQRGVTITGLTAQNKEYDGTATAVATGTPVISGVLGGDTVSADTSAAAASFADKNAGTGKTVTFTGYKLSGASAGNYNLTSQPAQVTADITAKQLTNFSLKDSPEITKVYDGTASLPAGAAYTINADGIFAGDTPAISYDSTASGYNSAEVADANSVTFSNLTTADSNYSIAEGASLVYNTQGKVSITQKSVIITWPAETTFKYDTREHVVQAAVGGIVAGDADKVDILYAAAPYTTRATAIGDYTAKISSLSGEKAGNYTLPSSGLECAWEIVENPMKVTFDIQGHGDYTPDTQTVNYGEKVTEPRAPSEEGLTFAGWYTDTACTSEWIFDTDVVREDVTLYAKWVHGSYTITFNGNGGTVTPQTITLQYGDTLTLDSATATRDKYTHSGWAVTPNGKAVYAVNQMVQDLGDITLYAVWTKTTETAGISVKVMSEEETPLSGVTVQLKEGNAVLDNVTTSGEGLASFNSLAKGTYNLVATTKDGKVVTKVVTIPYDAQPVPLIIPYKNINSVVDVSVKSGTPAVIVDGVSEAAAQEIGEKQSVTLTVKVEAKIKGDKATTETETQKEIEKIIAIAGGSELDYLGITVEKSVDGQAPKKLDTTVNVLKFIIPYDFTGKKQVKLYRCHDEKAKPLKEIKSETEVEDGSYILDKEKGLIYLYADKFSTYSVGYITDSGKRSHSSQGSSTWATEPVEPTVTPTPTAEPTQGPTPGVPTVKPTETQTPAKSPMPLFGLLAGLGCAAVVFGLRRK